MRLSNRFKTAFDYAYRLHADQVRKGTDVPYISHLMAVAGLALEHGADEDEAVAALLHDAIEDQGGAAIRDEVRALFGDQVLEIVDQCSEQPIVPKPPWRDRKEAYISHLAGVSSSAMLVSAADKVHNLRNIAADHEDIGEAIWDRFNGGKDGTLWYYRALFDVFNERQGIPGGLLKEMERLVDRLERLAAATGH